MVCVYMPAYLDTIHPTLLLVSMHVWSSVLWNCFYNHFKSPLPDPWPGYYHSLGNLEM